MVGKRLGFTSVVLVLGLVVLVLALPTAAIADSARIYVRSLPDRASFDHYSRVLGSDRFGKFIIDVNSDEIYFIDVNVFKLHADFILPVLLKQQWTDENILEYNKNYERDKPRFILGYVTEHLKVNRFTFAFWEGDKIDADGVVRVAEKLRKTFFVEDIAFRPDSPAQEQVARLVERRGISTTTNDKIYQAARYQSFNKGRAVGRLRVVKSGAAYQSLSPARGDIVMLQQVYPDISPVAGILSATFSTPLSHVNLRATAWGIPNAGFRDAYQRYARLHDQMVFYEVGDTEHTLRLATPSEIAAHQQQLQHWRSVTIPAADVSSPNLRMLTEMGAHGAHTYGAKSANLGQIAGAGLSDVNVPLGFGVPFFYYVRHLQRHGIGKQIAATLAHERFETDTAWRKGALAALRTAITSAPLDNELLNMLYDTVQRQLGDGGVFVRSSTNAEDLEGFNGAGLYDTVPNVHGKVPLGAAVKQVWASLWNFRAVEERALYGIDHGAVFSGVLIQTGVDASAAGVLVTTNLYNPEESASYTINAKWGLGIRVVEGTNVPEQIIFDPLNEGTKIISRSDDPVMLVFDEQGGIREIPNPHHGVILTEERTKRLASAVTKIVPLFSRRNPLEIEWLFEGEKVWLVQARPYVTAR